VTVSRQQRALELARTVGQAHGTVLSVERFPMGLCHHVFDVELHGGSRVVVRVADPEHRPLLLGAIAWADRLRPLGVPLPAILAHDVEPDSPLPYLVLERLPGADLGLVYAKLTPAQRQSLAASVVAVQRVVHGLGAGAGHGYSADPSGRAPHDSWAEVVLDNLRRSGGRLQSAPPRVRELHARVVDLVSRSRRLLDGVPAVPFLDDLTTKNVIVDGARLAGVVDVDVVCFGDPLYTPALTKVSLVAADLPTDYVDAWLALLAPDRSGRTAFDVYCAVFCLDLISEVGVAFNRDAPPVEERERTERLLRLAHRLAAS